MKTQFAPTEALRQSLGALLQGRSLSASEVKLTFHALAHAEASPTLKSAVLIALQAKGVSCDELAAFAEAMLQLSLGPIPQAYPLLVDTCGTGGDGSMSFNISSAAALLVASLGIPVAKHGNRSISSSSGSADFFGALGLAFPTQASAVQAALAEHGFAFLFAPDFHPAMAGLAGLRRELGHGTVFNLLGPLVNPARPTHQLIGCSDVRSARLLARTAAQLGVQRAFVVLGALGWDEATPCGPFRVFEMLGSHLNERTMNPEQFGVQRCEASGLRTGDAAHNALLAMQLLHGQPGPLRDAVVLNAALVLMLVGAAVDPMGAADMAREALDSHRALTFLKRLTHKKSNDQA